MNKNTELIAKLKRGIITLTSEEELLAKLSKGKPLRIKLGVDPTSPDLHLGHTVLLHKLRLFQDYGHIIVFIIGDFTARIGDPSGRDETRPLLTEEKILSNAKIYQEQVFKILKSGQIEVVYNSSWLLKLFGPDINILMTNLFSKYTVQQLLEREDFTKRRQENKPISMLEMMYPLFQGYDSVAVKADVEFGGNDQLFNLLMGRQLQRDFGQEPQVIVTMPLLVGTDGVKKMSKSYNNYIALKESPKDMFGKVMSISDDTMLAYYELITDCDMNEVKEKIKKDPRNAKADLGSIITERYHGKEGAEAARAEFDKVFSKKELPEDMPVFETSKSEYNIVDLVADAKMAPSRNEARRLVLQGAVEVDDKRVNEIVNVSLKDGSIIKVGKRKYCKIKL